jgi:hypothetical protein
MLLENMLRRAPRLAQVTDVSDQTAGITGTISNVSCGLVPGKPGQGTHA